METIKQIQLLMELDKRMVDKNVPQEVLIRDFKILEEIIVEGKTIELLHKEETIGILKRTRGFKEHYAEFNPFLNIEYIIVRFKDEYKLNNKKEQYLTLEDIIEPVTIYGKEIILHNYYLAKQIFCLLENIAKGTLSDENDDLVALFRKKKNVTQATLDEIEVIQDIIRNFINQKNISK